MHSVVTATTKVGHFYHEIKTKMKSRQTFRGSDSACVQQLCLNLLPHVSPHPHGRRPDFGRRAAAARVANCLVTGFYWQPQAELAEPVTDSGV